jgi:hypothetical protein
MYEQGRILKRLAKQLSVMRGSSNVVHIWGADAVAARVKPRTDATPLDSTGGLGQSGELRGEDLADDKPRPKIAHEASDFWQTGAGPRPERGQVQRRLRLSTPP